MRNIWENSGTQDHFDELLNGVTTQPANKRARKCMDEGKKEDANDIPPRMTRWKCWLSEAVPMISNVSMSMAYIYPTDEGWPDDTTPSNRFRKVGPTNWDRSLTNLKGRAVRIR